MDRDPQLPLAGYIERGIVNGVDAPHIYLGVEPLGVGDRWSIKGDASVDCIYGGVYGTIIRREELDADTGVVNGVVGPVEDGEGESALLYCDFLGNDDEFELRVGRGSAGGGERQDKNEKQQEKEQKIVGMNVKWQVLESSRGIGLTLERA